MAADRVVFGTNWKAQAEHGGYYQAVADGTYRKYGLEVVIEPGGPQRNDRLLLATGKLDFYMGGNLIPSFFAVQQKIPTKVIAAIFQKEPQAILAHPDVGIEKFEDLKSIDLLIGKGGLATFYRWMVAAYDFSEERVRPYTFNAAPFLADKKIGMQGYVTSDPYEIERTGGFKPKVFLLADYGFDTYSTTIEARIDTIEKHPDMVQRFVDASIIGWYNYLYGDHRAANELIKKDNPEMTDARLAAALAGMKAYGIVDSGDALSLGIGAMTDARVKSFFEKMVQAQVFSPDLDYRQAYTLQFVNKGVGKELRHP
ncbi:MAG: ABC transporter substrate-binding protein [Alphaproteobacteria bacterium]